MRTETENTSPTGIDYYYFTVSHVQRSISFQFFFLLVNISFYFLVVLSVPLLLLITGLFIGLLDFQIISIALSFPFFYTFILRAADSFSFYVQLFYRIVSPACVQSRSCINIAWRCSVPL